MATAEATDLSNVEIDIAWAEQFGISKEALQETNDILMEIARNSEDDHARIKAAKAVHDNFNKIVSLQLRCATHAVQMKKYLDGLNPSETPLDDKNSVLNEDSNPDTCLDGLVVCPN